MIKVGIIGYGNVGKKVEEEISLHNEFELVKIFTLNGECNTEKFDNILNYKNSIELMFVCVGSQSDLVQVELKIAPFFNIIDCYDNHTKFKTLHNKLKKVAIENKKFILSGFGWDPGLFSYVRGWCEMLNTKPFTFWGKGVSQGHTQAIKNIPFVIDAIQFTIPNKNAVKLSKRGQEFKDAKVMHKRLCYVVCNKKDEQIIKQQIVKMPDYFLGYKTTVKFVSQQKLNKLKTFKHRGLITSKNNEINFKLNLASNPQFTAKVMVAYAKSFVNLKKQFKPNVYTIFDIPLSFVINNKYDLI